MSRITYNLIGAAALSVAFVSPAVMAQSDKERKLDEIVVVGKYLYADQVNALRSPTPIIDVPQSLSIITADQITQQGFTSLGDIISYTPGVNTSQGEGHRDAIVFRGVRSTADFFIDGFRDDVQYYRPLYNLEQVEILRGPNALLFGRGGTGGILNRVTKKSVVGEQFNAFKAGIDTFGAYNLELDSNVSPNDVAGFRLNAMYETLENHRDFFDGERIGINPTAEVKLTDKTTLDLSYEYLDHERFIDRGIPTGTNGEPVEAFEDIVFGDEALNVSQLEAHLLRAMLTHQFSDRLKGRFSAFYGDYEKSYANFYASSYDQANTPDRVGIDGYVDTTQRENLILSADLIGEFVTGPIGHTIVTGAEYIDTANNNDRFNPVWSASQDDVEFFTVQRPLNFRNGTGVNADGLPTSLTFSDLNDDTEADLQVFSAYFQDQIEISEHLDIILGARFDSFEIDVLNVVTGERRDRTDEELSPRLGLVYKPQETVSFYASYSESFLPASGEQFADINGDDNRLDPSEFDNLEAGVKWDVDDRLSITAAVFEIQQRSPELDDTTGGERQIFIESEITGFEVQLQGQVSDRWFLSGGYSYLDGEQAGSSLRPRELPENMLSLWNTYQLTAQLGVGLGVTYQDESFIDNGNTALLPAYTRVDAAAFYDVSETLRVQLNVENLTDELYFPDAHSTHQASVGAPLNARITVSGRF